METPEDLNQPTELDMLKQRATQMGIVFSNNIGLDKLRERVNAKMEGLPDPEDAPTPPALATPAVAHDVVVPVASVAPALPVAPVVEAPVLNALTGLPEGVDPDAGMTTRQILMRDQMKLVRVRIANLDPSKKDLSGEILTVANEYIGTVRKFIPFGEATDEGYHVPQCLLSMMQERKFQTIRTIKDRRTGTVRVETGEAREFAIEILEPLSEAEMRQLATAQQAAGGL